MARKSRKNMPVAVAEPTDNLTTKAVLSMDKEAKPYQVGIYARLSFESEANKERDTVDTQIAYIREFINSQDDMVEVEVYADISVTGTTFERPEFDRMIQDIRAGRINTVITRDLSRLGRNYVEAGNYIERVFPFLDVRYIAITDDFDTARPGTDLSVPLKNIVNEYYSSDDIGQEIESLKKAKAHYAKLKFEIYDDYTRTNITREQMAKKTAEVKNKIAELDKMIAEKQELFDLQKDLFVDAKQEQLTKLSKLDKFDEDVIRNIIDYVLIYDNEHIEIKWNFDDFHIE